MSSSSSIAEPHDAGADWRARIDAAIARGRGIAVPPVAPGTEPLLTPSRARLLAVPICYPGIYDLYKKAEANFWTTDEVELKSDREHFEALDPAAQAFVEGILAFFAVADGIVMENLAVKFMAVVQVCEARLFYGFQIAMEGIHSVMYGLLLETISADTAHRNAILHAALEHPSITRKTDWAQRWIDGPDVGYAHGLVAFAAVEGIFFSGSFAAIFWLKTKGRLPGLTFATEKIFADEGMHCDFACHLYRHVLRHKLPEEVAYAIIAEATAIECAFWDDFMPAPLLGLNKTLMQQHVRSVADRTLVALGYGPLFAERTPFDFMNLIGMEGKTNFFERKVAEYGKANSGASEDERRFATDAPF